MFPGLCIQALCVVFFFVSPTEVTSLRHLLGDPNGISKSPEPFSRSSPLASDLGESVTINDVSPVTEKHVTKSDGGSETEKKGETHSLNLTILPILAVLAFLICLCLKCCKIFRENVKHREGDDDDERGFVIITEGDNEYRDVEFRSDTTSMGYDTVSSYTSFIRRNNNYDTVTSVRSLQLPRNGDTHNSYRSFLLQRLDGSRNNTVNSYRAFIQNAVEMKDVEVQVELLDVPKIHLKRSPVLSTHRNCRNMTKYRRQRHSSCDAIVLSETHKTPKSSESSENSNSPNESPNVVSRYTRRSQRNRVSFFDNTKGPKIVVSRSLSSADKDHAAISILNDRRRRSERHSSLSPARHVSKEANNLVIPSSPKQLPDAIPRSTTKSAIDRPNTNTTTAKSHRFKVSKAQVSDHIADCENTIVKNINKEFPTTIHKNNTPSDKSDINNDSRCVDREQKAEERKTETDSIAKDTVAGSTLDRIEEMNLNVQPDNERLATPSANDCDGSSPVLIKCDCFYKNSSDPENEDKTASPGTEESSLLNHSSSNALADRNSNDDGSISDDADSGVCSEFTLLPPSNDRDEISKSIPVS